MSATNPTCAPGRSAFFTGVHQTSIDARHMRSHLSDDFRLPAGARPITHRLRDAGGFTANVRQIGDKTVGAGKLHLNFCERRPICDKGD